MEKSAKIKSFTLALRHALDIYNFEPYQEFGSCLYAF